MPLNLPREEEGGKRICDAHLQRLLLFKVRHGIDTPGAGMKRGPDKHPEENNHIHRLHRDEVRVSCRDREQGILRGTKVDISRGCQERTDEWKGIIPKDTGTSAEGLILRKGANSPITGIDTGNRIRSELQDLHQLHGMMTELEDILLGRWKGQDMVPQIEIFAPIAEGRFLRIQIIVYYADGAGQLMREDQVGLIIREDLILMIEPEDTELKRVGEDPLKVGKDVLMRRCGEGRHHRERRGYGTNRKQRSGNPKEKGPGTGSSARTVEIPVSNSLQMGWVVAPDAEADSATAQGQQRSDQNRSINSSCAQNAIARTCNFSLMAVVYVPIANVNSNGEDEIRLNKKGGL